MADLVGREKQTERWDKSFTSFPSMIESPCCLWRFSIMLVYLVDPPP